ncbi:uncharacterized protein B0H18DRAFT_254307 [Fomitopsis serialis]|uniref:uncharacterized protein n=1 Tax=Fomitopsis serialis TaxID=139415 RepID=UPI0020087FC5|nr:uncharacterized protein B0H18DRAFT_254307 [Neoantrodia serialis]KAH9928306.1 hypothetical protein B0H18DRAFT_254307 [Neoantrodia serialis]
MSQPAGLVYLPEDILLEVASHLSVFDVLSLKQTCRTLYAFGSTDYLWHRIVQRIDIPLDLPPDTPLSALAHYELQPIVLKALRLEANWRRRPPRLKTLRLLPRDTQGQYVDQMHFVQGGRWLLTVQRNRQRGRPGSHLEVWSLEDEPYAIANVDTTGLYRTAVMELKEANQSITLAVGYQTDDLAEVVAVYSVPFRDRSEFLFYTAPTLTPTTTLRVSPHPSVKWQSAKFIHQLSLSDGRLVVSVVDPTGQTGMSLLQVCLMDIKSRVSRWLDPKYLRVRLSRQCPDPSHTNLSPQRFSDVSVKIHAHNGHLLLLGPARQSITLRVYAMPPSLLPKLSSDTCDPANAFLDLGPPISEYEQPLRHHSQFQDIIHVSPPSAASISALVVCSFHDTSPRVGQVTRFPLPPGPAAVRGPRLPGASRDFSMPSHVSAQLAQVGPSGRAVWVEHDWEAQKKRFMRFQMRRDEWDGAGVPAAVGALLPPDVALPFLPDTVHSLAFDEVTGRVCLGLFNGDIYVMDFV